MCKKSEKKDSAENWEILIIGLCILLLLFGLTTFVVKQWWLTPEPQKVEVVLVPKNNINTTYTYDRASIDSLITVVNNCFTDNEKKYVDSYNAQEDNRLKSLASMLIGIISSIALFFGYKSFRDIREKGKQMSIEVAEKAAKTVAKESAKEYLESKLPDIVKEELNKGIYDKQVIDTTKASIIAEIRPSLLEELKKELGHKSESDTDQLESGEPAMSPEEMFNTPSTIKTEDNPMSEKASSDAPIVETQKEESDGKD